MTIPELVNVIDGKWTQKTNKREIHKIRVDSKEIEKGDIFLAISSGHDHVNEAIGKGAIGIIVNRPIDTHKKVNIIEVTDTIKALQDIGHYLRIQYKPVVIGITGSSGKTTTKEMLYNILKDKFNVLKSSGNENNHIGVPKTLLKINQDTDIVLVEMGMNHRGEISLLSKIALPDVALITNIGVSHIGNLGSREEILNAKLEIIDGMDDGILILNNDDIYLKKVRRNILTYRVSTHESKEVELVAYNIKKVGTYIEAEIYSEGNSYHITAPSKPFLVNMLLAIQTGLLFDIDIQYMVNQVNSFRTMHDRLEVIEKNTTTIISDCYNASYESYINGLDVIKSSKKEKILVLADMLELGNFSNKYHKKLGRKIRKIKNCQIILLGDYVKYIKKYNQTRTIWCNTIEEIKKVLSILDLNNKIIFIKGAHFFHLEDVVAYLKEIL